MADQPLSPEVKIELRKWIRAIFTCEDEWITPEQLELARAAYRLGQQHERNRLAKYASAESRYWEDQSAGDISIGGVAAASNICSEAMVPGKAIGRKYDADAETITDDPEAFRFDFLPEAPPEKGETTK